MPLRTCPAAYRLLFHLVVVGTLQVSQDVHAQWLYTQRGVGYGVKDLGLVVRDHEDSLVILARSRLLPNLENGYQLPELATFAPEDWILAKFGADKKLRWFCRLGGSDVPAFSRLAADRAGDIYAAGFFEGTARLETGPISTSLTSRGQCDICLVRFGPDGSLVSVRQWGGAGDERVESCTLAGDGSIILAGSFKGIFTASLPEGERVLHAPGPVRDGFVLGLDRQGNERWVLHAAADLASDPGSSGSILPLMAGADAAGNCFVTGGFEPRLHLHTGARTATFDSRGLWDMFLAKLDANGVLQWARTAGGPGGDYGLRVLVDGEGSAFVTGRFSEGAWFGEGDRIARLRATSGADMFMACYDADGRFLGAARTGGTGPVIDHEIWTIVMDELGNRYLVGAAGQPAQPWARSARQLAVEQNHDAPATLNLPSRFESIERTPDGSIRIVLDGRSEGIYLIETSTDLETWTVVSTHQVTAGLILIEDRIDTREPKRFYRIRQPASGMRFPR